MSGKCGFSYGFAIAMNNDRGLSDAVAGTTMGMVGELIDTATNILPGIAGLIVDCSSYDKNPFKASAKALTCAGTKLWNGFFANIDDAVEGIKSGNTESGGRGLVKLAMAAFQVYGLTSGISRAAGLDRAISHAKITETFQPIVNGDNLALAGAEASGLVNIAAETKGVITGLSFSSTSTSTRSGKRDLLSRNILADEIIRRFDLDPSLKAKIVKQLTDIRTKATRYEILLCDENAIIVKAGYIGKLKIELVKYKDMKGAIKHHFQITDLENSPNVGFTPGTNLYGHKLPGGSNGSNWK